MSVVRDILFQVENVSLDVRFPDEADAIRGAGGRVVRLARGAGAGGTHSSETALDDYPRFDLEVPADATANDALWEVTKVLGVWFPDCIEVEGED